MKESRVPTLKSDQKGKNMKHLKITISKDAVLIVFFLKTEQI